VKISPTKYSNLKFAILLGCSFEYAGGDKYKGDYVKGKKHGRGVYTFANGDVYEGILIRVTINSFID